jgi:putative glutamine amidotransferase
MIPLAPRIAIPEPSATDPDYTRQSWPVYAGAVERAGGIPVRVPLDESPTKLAAIISSCVGVLLPGSPADLDPEKYGQQPIGKCNKKDGLRESADELLLQDAFNLQKPVFGICYGMQSLNVWKSGSLIQDLPTFEEQRAAELGAGEAGGRSKVNHRPGREVRHAHPVSLVPDSHLSEILAGSQDLEGKGEDLGLSVNSSHHQAIDRPGDQMRVVARSPQDGVIEALEGQFPGQFVVAVQWHPERTYDVSPASQALFRAFVEAARAWHPHPIQESVQEAAEDPASENSPAGDLKTNSVKG